MVGALTHTNLGGSLVTYSLNFKGQGHESLVDFDLEVALTFHFEVKDLLELTFQDGSKRFVLTRQFLTTGHVDIEANNVIGGELELEGLLVSLGPVDDDIFAIEAVVAQIFSNNFLDENFVLIEERRVEARHIID